MSAACDLCHTSGDSRNPFLGSSNGTAKNSGLGCSGCHIAEGLRAHHTINGVALCGACHTNDAPPVVESVAPPYYGEPDDSNVENPLNPVLAANTNENWTIGDFIGTDNDGDNLYDMADFDGGYPIVITEGGIISGTDVQLTWTSARGSLTLA